MKWLRQHPHLACLLSAGLYFGSWYQPILVFVALIPWLAVLQEASPKQAWRKSYYFGLLYSLSQLYWLAQLTVKWTGSPLLAAVPWLLASVLMAIYFGLVGKLIAACLQRGWLLAVPLAWAGMEVFRSYIPVFAFPWGLLATPFVGCPLVPGIARFGTVYLVSAWALIPSLLLFARPRAQWALLAGFFALALLPIAINPDASAITKRIMVAQPGVDVAFSDPRVAEVELRRSVENLVAQAAEEQVDLVVLPEGVERLGDAWPPQLPYARVPMIVGAQRGSQPVFQSAASFDGAKWEYADKTRLVIFGEFVPLRDQLPFLKSFNLPSGDISAGNRVSALHVGGLTVGPLICFEALFPDLAWRQRQNGAQILAVMSIDDWFMGSIAPDQLRAASIWRSYETGLPLIRSASTGASLVTDARGKVLTELPPKLPGAKTVVVRVPRTTGGEPWQLIFPVASLASLVGLPLLLRVTSVRNRAPAQSLPDADSETDQSPTTT